MSGTSLKHFHEGAKNINDGDFILASYPGSGHAWLANVLLQLGIPYYDPYTEFVPPFGSSTRFPFDMRYRQRFAAQFRIDNNLLHTNLGPRVIKTHVIPDFIGTDARLGGVIVLVREALAAIESYYHWRISFVTRFSNQSLDDFMESHAINGETPLLGWATFAPKWVEFCAKQEIPILTIRLESVRQSNAEVREVCRFVKCHVQKSDVDAALVESTFEAMLNHEREMVVTHSLDPVFIMRRSPGEQRTELRTIIDRLDHEWKVATEELVRLGY